MVLVVKIRNSWDQDGNTHTVPVLRPDHHLVFKLESNMLQKRHLGYANKLRKVATILAAKVNHFYTGTYIVCLTLNLATGYSSCQLVWSGLYFNMTKHDTRELKLL